MICWLLLIALCAQVQALQLDSSAKVKLMQLESGEESRWLLLPRAPDSELDPTLRSTLRSVPGGAFVIQADAMGIRALGLDDGWTLVPERLLHPCLDVARGLCALDSLVQSRPEGSHDFDGSGVLVGIVDTGIDCEHGDFWSDDECRILSVWDQTEQRTYSHSEILQHRAGCLDSEGHGTHVASIAAGNGNSAAGSDEGGPFVGFAPGAELLVVRSTLCESDVVEGVRWVFERAAELGRPCVVNLSLETQQGPHDGGSWMEEQLAALCGPGRLVVCAAGNSASLDQHASAEFNTSQQVQFVCDEESGWLDVWVWGAYPQVTLTLPGGALLTGSAQTYRQNGWNIALPTAVLTDDRWHIALELSAVANTVDPLSLRIICQEENNLLHAWADGVHFLIADSLSTLGSPASADSVLVAGNLVSRATWTDIDGNGWRFAGENLGEMATSSARGPRVDGRRVPQLSLPGQGIFAAMSSALAGIESQRVYRHADGTHILRGGTSMAAPALTGLLALLLQYEPLTSCATADTLLAACGTSAEWDAARGYSLPDARSLLAEYDSPLWAFTATPSFSYVDLAWWAGDEAAGRQLELSRLCGTEESLLLQQTVYSGNMSFRDTGLLAGTDAVYRIILFQDDGSPFELRTTSVRLLTGSGPRITSLYPNPVFGGEFTVSIALPKTAFCSLELFDLLGRCVCTWPQGVLDSGLHQIKLKPSDHTVMAAGWYALHAEALGAGDTKSMLWIPQGR